MNDELETRRIVRFLFAVVMFGLMASGCRKEEPAAACCSCVCVTQDGGACTGAKREAHGEETCEERCAVECAANGCRVDEATMINEGACEGGLLPFLSGVATAR